jgi:tellurite methyltransferase
VASADNASVEFFDRQFRRQVGAADYALNPFESAALPWMHGDVLDLGCGLGNLAFAAALQGARVTALDASEAGVENLARRAREAALDITASAADLRGWRPDREWDAVACIGLLMFFEPRAARAGLEAVRDAVRPGGIAAVNVLIEGTTYLEMFDPSGYCLFGEGELARAFAGWEPLHRAIDEFPAPGATLKRFETLVARRR